MIWLMKMRPSCSRNHWRVIMGKLHCNGKSVSIDNYWLIEAVPVHRQLWIKSSCYHFAKALTSFSILLLIQEMRLSQMNLVTFCLVDVRVAKSTEALYEIILCLLEPKDGGFSRIKFTWIPGPCCEFIVASASVQIQQTQTSNGPVCIEMV